MDDVIMEYDLNPEGLVDHDAVCTAQAGNLLQNGYLEYEVAAYGTAVYRDGDVYYYISAKEESVTRFIRQCYLHEQYPTPIRYFFKRYDLLHSSEEAVREAFRLHVARALQAAYPLAFFQGLTGLTQEAAPGAAWPILSQLTAQIENSFDPLQLGIFANLLEQLLPARLISVEGYQLLGQWLEHEREKLAIEPAKAGVYQRTYAGFAYQRPDGQLAYFADAFPHMAQEKQTALQSQGCLTTPILTSTYFADAYPQLAVIRERFQKDLRRYLGQGYLDVMRLLRSLPPTVDAQDYGHCLQALEQSGAAQAASALRWYGYLWNVEKGSAAV